MIKKKMNNNGFTLIEVIVATSLLAFIMLGVISISNNTIDTKEKIITEDRDKLQIQTALSRISWDFSHIYSPLYFSKKYEKPKNNQDEYYDDNMSPSISGQYEDNDRFSFASAEGLPVPKIITQDKTTIEFFTTSNRNYQINAHQSRYGWVRYSLEDMELTDKEKSNELGEHKLVRTFSSRDPYSSEKDLLDKEKSYEILEHISKFTIEYWDREKEKFVDSMLTFKDEDKHLLRAIRIIVEWKGLPDSDPITISKIFRPLWPYFKEDPNDLKPPVTEEQSGEGEGEEASSKESVEGDEI